MRAVIRNYMVMVGAGFFISFPSVAAAEPAGSTALWQGLVVGMTPEEALTVVQQIGGVKRAKVLKERKSNPDRRIDIDYDTDKISIADLPFEIGPRFDGGRLLPCPLNNLIRDRPGFGAATAAVEHAVTNRFSLHIARDIEPPRPLWNICAICHRNMGTIKRTLRSKTI
ncbi:MAG TPA: hypothetical protein VGN68_08255 [Sphingopyxis sp.]|uniref:hypothetical protein n=1 Tax=Sphingopyxis sp. TaxID=1908224 RepID=UPI002E1307E9|nr:hypothetical protein [Sphingopyxis sp.]